MASSLPPDIESSLATVLNNWERMQKSEMMEADTDAEQFEASFYAFIKQVSLWMNSLPQKPSTLEEALQHPVVAQIAERLPAVLYLNFETEIDLLCDGIIREADEKYD